MKLLVRNLARNMNEDQLREVFAAFGVVSNCTIVLDKMSNKSKGFGFVEMPNKTEAIKALRQLNTRRVMDSVIRVKEATTT